MNALLTNQKSQPKIISLFFLSVLTGLLISSSFPPLYFWFLGFVAVTPLFFIIEKSSSRTQAVLFSAMAGAIAAGITTYPLMSASVWAGWVDFDNIDNAKYFKTRDLALHGIWLVMLSAGGALVFGIYAFCLRWFDSSNKTIKFLLVSPILWLIIVEWLRSKLLFDYHWMPIGSTLIDLPWIAQLASLGGEWLLGFVVVAFNGLIYLIFFYPKIARKSYLGPVVFCTLLLVATFWGKHKVADIDQSLKPDKALKVAMIQFAKPSYTEADFTSFYMDKEYFKFVKNLYKEYSDKFDILVLPESIDFGSINLDGIKSQTEDKTTSTIQDWYNALKPLITPSSLLIFGADTVSKGLDHNSLLVWNSSGPIWLYHKQRLVPFAEERPEWLNTFGLQGKSTYSPGTSSQVAKTNKINIGFFICQEVLFPDVIQQSILDGSQLLITVGNDGVFSNPAVANANAIAARMRAIESGRYIIRSMKSGISGVIKPSGQYRSKMGINEKGVIFSKIIPIKEQTIYTSLHPYILDFLFTLMIIFGISELINRKQKQHIKQHNDDFIQHIVSLFT